MDWNKISNLFEESFPKCVKIILSVCGYDTIASLRSLNGQSVLEIQRQVRLYFQSTIQDLSCCHSNFYKQQLEFEFLPGHRDFILAIPEYLKPIPTAQTAYNSSFSTIMKAMIDTAENNLDKDKNHAQYNEIVRYFATYIFLSCGRSCYEVLNQNMPFPSTKTVRE